MKVLSGYIQEVKQIELKSIGIYFGSLKFSTIVLTLIEWLGIGGNGIWRLVKVGGNLRMTFFIYFTNSLSLAQMKKMFDLQSELLSVVELEFTDVAELVNSNWRYFVW